MQDKVQNKKLTDIAVTEVSQALVLLVLCLQLLS